jgi:transposase
MSRKQKITKEKLIETGLFEKLGPTLAKELGVSLATIATYRHQYRNDPSFPRSVLYQSLVPPKHREPPKPTPQAPRKWYTDQDYIDAGLFETTAREVAAIMGVNIQTVTSRKYEIRHKRPASVPPEVLDKRQIGRKPRFTKEEWIANGLFTKTMTNLCLECRVSPELVKYARKKYRTDADFPRADLCVPANLTTREKALEAIKSSKTWAEATGKLGLSKEAFLGMVVRLNLIDEVFDLKKA